MKIKITFLAIVFALLSSSGCSVYMASQQPEKKNVGLFKTGTPRSILLGEFGYPIAQTEHDGKKWDIWKFRQGYGGGAKAGRAIGHAAADVVTLGLWEVVGTPVESVANGNDVAYEIAYDDHGNVSDVILLSKNDGK